MLYREIINLEKYYEMTDEEIIDSINAIRCKARVELFEKIEKSKQLELLKLHAILVYKHIKWKQPDLSIRNRMMRIYSMLITEYNIESCYNLKIKVFVKEFYECKLKGITD